MALPPQQRPQHRTRTLMLTPSTRMSPRLVLTATTLPTLPLSLPAMTATVSPSRTCIDTRCGLPLLFTGVCSHFLPGPCKRRGTEQGRRRVGEPACLGQESLWRGAGRGRDPHHTTHDDCCSHCQRAWCRHLQGAHGGMRYRCGSPGAGRALRHADHRAEHNAPAHRLTRCCRCTASGRLVPKKPLRARELHAMAMLLAAAAPVACKQVQQRLHTRCVLLWAVWL